MECTLFGVLSLRGEGTNMKQPSPNQASEMHQWSVQLREHLAHLLPPGTNCSLSSVHVTPPPTTEGYITTIDTYKLMENVSITVEGVIWKWEVPLQPEKACDWLWILQPSITTSIFQQGNMHPPHRWKRKQFGVQLQDCFHLLLCYKHPYSHWENLDPTANTLGISSKHSACRNGLFTSLLWDHLLQDLQRLIITSKLLHYENCHNDRIASARDPYIAHPKTLIKKMDVNEGCQVVL